MWLTHQKKMVKKDVKRMMMMGVDKEDLVTFTFTEFEVENELKWKHSKEFEYQGNMYDIVSFQEVEGKFVYRCWLDKKEPKLNTQLSKLFGLKWNTEKGKYHSQTNLDHFVDSLFYSNSNVLKLNLSMVTYRVIQNDFHLLDFNVKQQTPPPQLF
jgi:hypothetical protein